MDALAVDAVAEPTPYDRLVDATIRQPISTALPRLAGSRACIVGSRACIVGSRA